MKRLIALFLTFVFMAGQVYAVDINDWIRGDGTDAIKGTDNVSDIDANATAYLQDPLDRLLYGEIYGCTLTWASASTITVGIGSVTCANGADTVHRMRKNVATATLNMAVVGVGGIDSGSHAGAEQASTLYSVYAVADADATTFTVICGEQGVALSDVTYYRYLGSIYNNSGSDLEKFYGIGTGHTVKIVYDDVYLNTEVRVLNAGAAVAFTDVDCSDVVPSSSRMCSFDVVSAGSTGGGPYWRANSSATSGVVISMAAASWTVINDLPLDSSQIGEYKVTASNITLYVKDYTYTR